MYQRIADRRTHGGGGSVGIWNGKKSNNEIVIPKRFLRDSISLSFLRSLRRTHRPNIQIEANPITCENQLFRCNARQQQLNILISTSNKWNGQSSSSLSLCCSPNWSCGLFSGAHNFAKRIISTARRHTKTVKRINNALNKSKTTNETLDAPLQIRRAHNDRILNGKKLYDFLCNGHDEWRWRRRRVQKARTKVMNVCGAARGNKLNHCAKSLNCNLMPVCTVHAARSVALSGPLF